MSRQKVTEKIIADAKNEAKEILDKYRNEATKIKHEYEEKIAAKRKLIEEETEVLKKTEYMKMISQKKLEFNKEFVLKKHQFIKEIIDEALTKIPKHKEYLSFLKALIKTSGEKEGEIIVSRQDWKTHGKDLENYMRKEGIKYTVVADNKIIGGVVVRKDKITYHGSLDLISELLYDQLAIEVSKKFH